MSTLGILLAWGAVQVTLFAVVGAVIYSMARRRGPAAGSLAALASLLIVLAVSLLVFSPWPTWYSAGAARDMIAANEAATIQPESNEQQCDASTLATERATPATPSELANASLNNQGHNANDVDARATAAAFWQAFVAELRPASVAEEQTARRWPSLVAAVLALGILLGVGRLSLGLVAVRRLRATSLPITDDTLLRQVDRLREQMGCHHSVEIRESVAVSTPATIGWRRPLVILPLSWRTWTEREQDAVLAHEIAHVCRADYAAAILAQMCLAVHFYHPLVHWLARRLRLEQELAADALGARVAGGREQYLRSLAALALAQDNRRLAWAARPFLPETGTLLRRIEMLRDRKQQFQASLSRAWRVGLVAILIVAGLGIAGLRGPGEGAINLVQAAPPEEKQAASADKQAAPSDRKEFALTYVPANATFVVAVRAAKLTRNEALMQLLPLAAEPFEPKYGMSIAQLEEVYVINCKQPSAPGGYEGLMIFRSIEPLDANKHATLLMRDPVADAQGVFRTRGADDLTLGCFLPDVRTLVVGYVGTLGQLAARGAEEAAKPRWAEQWKAVAKSPIALALDVKAIRGDVERELSPTPGAAPWIKLAAPLWEQTDMVVAGATVGDKLDLHAKAICVSPEGATKVQETSKALLTLALNMLDSMRDDSAKAPAGTATAALARMKPLFDVGETALKSVKFSQSGANLDAQAEVPLDAAKTLAALLPPVEAAREAALRTQSTNNMKQIALALHNYHDKHGKLPPAVVMGPDGTTPHSWRVEILPFLEADDLYKQYELDEPWDSESNRKVLGQMPPTLRDPTDDAKSTNASYFATTGDATAFSDKDGNKFQTFTDGMSNTIMVVEAKRDVPWTKPEDVVYDPAKALPTLGGHYKEGFLALFADGSVRLISKDAEEKLLRALFTKAGGEVVNVPN